MFCIFGKKKQTKEKNNQDILREKIFNDLKNSSLWQISDGRLVHSTKNIEICKDEQQIDINFCSYFTWTLYVKNLKLYISQKNYYILEKLCRNLINDKNKIYGNKIFNELLNSYYKDN